MFWQPDLHPMPRGQWVVQHHSVVGADADRIRAKKEDGRNVNTWGWHPHLRLSKCEIINIIKPNLKSLVHIWDEKMQHRSNSESFYSGTTSFCSITIFCRCLPCVNLLKWRKQWHLCMSLNKTKPKCQIKPINMEMSHYNVTTVVTMWFSCRERRTCSPKHLRKHTVKYNIHIFRFVTSAEIGICTSLLRRWRAHIGFLLCFEGVCKVLLLYTTTN